MNTATWSPQFEEILQSHLPWYVPGTAIAPDAALVDLGLDSLKTVSLLIAVEDTFGLVFPDELLASNTFATASSLWLAVQSAAERSGVAVTG